MKNNSVNSCLAENQKKCEEISNEVNKLSNEANKLREESIKTLRECNELSKIHKSLNDTESSNEEKYKIETSMADKKIKFQELKKKEREVRIKLQESTMTRNLLLKRYAKSLKEEEKLK